MHAFLNIPYGCNRERWRFRLFCFFPRGGGVDIIYWFSNVILIDLSFFIFFLSSSYYLSFSYCCRVLHNYIVLQVKLPITLVKAGIWKNTDVSMNCTRFSFFFLLVNYAYTLVKFERRREKRYRNSQSIEYSTWRIQAMSAKHNLSNRSGELRSSHNESYCRFVLNKTSLNHFDYHFDHFVDGLHSFVMHIIRLGWILNSE